MISGGNAIYGMVAFYYVLPVTLPIFAYLFYRLLSKKGIETGNKVISGHEDYYREQWLHELSKIELGNRYYREILDDIWINDPIKEAIFRNFRDSDFDISKLCSILNTSRATLYRKWETRNDVSIATYITRLRMIYALHLLLNKDFSVSETAYLSGFNSQSYFTKVFKKELGDPPSIFVENYN